MPFELGNAFAQPVLLLEKVPEALPFVGASDGVEDVWGVTVEGLSGGAAEAGASSDGAVAAPEDGSGVGDAGVGG